MSISSSPSPIHSTNHTAPADIDATVLIAEAEAFLNPAPADMLLLSDTDFWAELAQLTATSFPPA